MKKLILSLSLFLIFLVGMAADASAKDLSRRIGLGIDSSISEFANDGRGLSFIYAINKYFGMQIIFGLDTTTAEVKNAADDVTYDTTIIDWNVSLRALIPIVLSSDVNLTGVVGFTASGRSSDGFNSNNELYAIYNDGYQFSIDLGVRPEWFVSEHFSLHTQVGIGISIITENGAALVTGLSKGSGEGDGVAYHSTKAKGADIDFFKNVDLLGMAGCTFWF
ncbi:MAG: hypothetical protein IJM59_08595 [Proteobacteria bacterium]|nr:hypothetical protein [Pseudomonadota bacterium]